MADLDCGCPRSRQSGCCYKARPEILYKKADRWPGIHSSTDGRRRLHDDAPDTRGNYGQLQKMTWANPRRQRTPRVRLVCILRQWRGAAAATSEVNRATYFCFLPCHFQSDLARPQGDG